MKKPLIFLICILCLSLTGCSYFNKKTTGNNQSQNNFDVDKTEPTKTEIIKELFAAKYNLNVDDVKIEYSQEEENHVRGTVSLGESEVGNAGIFLATNINGDWEIVFDGNGVFTCQEVESYNFPPGMIDDCYDPDSYIKESTPAETNKIAILKSLFIQEPNFVGVTEDDITIEINQETKHHLKGMVMIEPGGPGNAGGFMASDTLGNWELVWHGNGVYTCAQLDPYGFPPEMREGCYNE